MATVPATLRDDIAGRTAFHLAHDSGTACPDSLTSAGAAFLRRVTVGTLDRYSPHDDRADVLHEIADGAVPIYTHDLWSTFVDLAAYGEDVEDFAPNGVDLTQLAGVALYVIAERVAATVWDELAGSDGASC